MNSYNLADLPLTFSLGQISTLQVIRSKKRCLQNLSKLLLQGLSETEIQRLGEDFSEFDILDALVTREQLGSTSIGEGCAIPHGRINGIKEPKLAVLTLSEPLDFDAIDAEPIDIAFGLLVPESKHEEAQQLHLRILSMLASFLEDSNNRQFLRREMAAQSILSHMTYSLSELWADILSEFQQNNEEPISN